MPPKTPSKQPKIKTFARTLRSKDRSAPGSTPFMAVIEEEDYESFEEPLSEDVSLKEVTIKINEIGKRVENIEYAVYSEMGLKACMADQEIKAEKADGKMLFMSKECHAVKHDLGIVKGVLQRHDTQISTAEHKLTDITARSMAQNMIISGIIEHTDENCKFQVKDFLKNEMALDLDLCPEFKIKTEHRIGYASSKRTTPRPMVAKVNLPLKEAMIKNIEQLSGRTNVQGGSFYVNIQQPEARIEATRNAKALLKKFQGKYKTVKVEL